jgi:flagellar biosynthetic protein FliP
MNGIRLRRAWPLLTVLMLLLLGGAGAAVAQDLPLINATNRGGTTQYSVPVQTLLGLTALTFLPAALMLMTSFTRILIVFSLLRQALGLQSMPPNMVLTGLALFLTLFIMYPVGSVMYTEAYLPLAAGRLGFEEALAKAVVPLREFMLNQTRTEDINVFARMFSQPIASRAETPMAVLIPAFAVSEIKTGFLIGFMIYLPFLAIDFAVASILTSLGMVMVSPMMFSLPLKLVIFAMADGWSLLAASLVASYKV